MKSGALLVGCLLLSTPAAAQVVRVSVSTAGVEANGSSRSLAISGTGRFVAFESLASNLVTGDTNAFQDVFLRDRDTDADGVFDEAGAVGTTRISLGPNGVQADGPSVAPAITPDGRYVFFNSRASNFAPGASGAFDVYRLDRTAGTVIRVLSSVDQYVPAAVSDDGNFAVAVGPPLGGLLVVDVAAGEVTTIPAPYTLVHSFPSAHLEYARPTISADGTKIGYVAFVYVYRGAWYEDPRFYVFDRATGASTLVADGYLVRPALSASGTTALIERQTDAVRRVLATGAEAPVCATSPFTGFVLRPSPSLRHVLSLGGSLCDVDLGVSTPLGLVPIETDFSDDARFLAVSTATSTLLPGNADTNSVEDVFVFDLPDFFDADDDTMDDRWETRFGVTDASADPDGDGQTNAQEEDAGTHPNGQVQRFLAEGATGAFFHTKIGLANPSPTLAAAAVLTFDKGDGTRVRRSVGVPAGRSVVVDVGAVSGLEASDVSTTVETDRFVGVERAMSWGSSATDLYGSHAETAAPASSQTWFLTEGSTVLDFNLFYLLQNPQTTTAHATVRFLLPSGTTVTRTYDLAPGSRTTIYVNQVPGLDETDVSGDISADAPIVVERAMYRNLPGQPFGLGHGAMGVTAAAPSWFLAEGATGPFFDLYVLIANPGSADANVQARYARPDGSVVTQTYIVRANSRHSVYVDAIAGLENTSVATTLTAINGVPIVAERAMYWPGGFFDYYEGHASPGTTNTGLNWIVGGGEVGGANAAQTFVLIANTDNRIGEATITLLPDVGFTGTVPAPTTVSLPATSRTTFPISTLTGTFGVLVTSTGASPVQLVVESAVYRSVGGVTWAAGSNALATPVP